jgi:hypothetical protein
MFCFADYNKLMSGIENTIKEPDCKNPDFRHTSGCQGLSTGRQPIVPLYIIYVRVVQRVSSLVSNISEKHLNCFNTLKKKYARYNNALCMWKWTICSLIFTTSMIFVSSGIPMSSPVA